ncbi:MAG: S24 family peptidase [Alphaproteobacteria bacterium]
MFKHEDIWRGIDRLAAGFGYSPSGLAKKAGLDPTSFNKSKRHSPDGKPRWPSTESLSKILGVTGATVSDFISLIGDDSFANAETQDKTIPMIGFAQAGSSGFFDEDGYPAGNSWDEITFPAPRDQGNEHIFALQVSGNSMEPLYRKNDLLIVSPGARTKRGDRVIVRTRKGEVMLRELSRQNAQKITLKSLNPDFEDRILYRAEISWMARIMWVSQ